MTARVALVVLATVATARGHDGPPYPIVSDQRAGRYTVSIWTDPDATDDGSKGGQFWVVLEGAAGEAVPDDTRVLVSVRPLDRADPAQTVTAEPVRGQARNQFAGVLMDHEGPYAVAVSISGPLGPASVDSRVDATYDLRPPPYMLAWYLAPFVLVGLLWGRLLIKRRRQPS